MNQTFFYIPPIYLVVIALSAIASSFTIFVCHNSYIPTFIGMTFGTVCFGFLFFMTLLESNTTIAALPIFQSCNGFHVVRVDAVTNTAKMIYGKTIGNPTLIKSIGKTMDLFISSKAFNDSSAAPNSQSRISSGCNISLPEPATFDRIDSDFSEYFLNYAKIKLNHVAALSSRIDEDRSGSPRIARSVYYRHFEYINQSKFAQNPSGGSVPGEGAGGEALGGVAPSGGQQV